MKKEIMWNNNKWIVDYETKTIYQKATVFEDDPNLLTVQARIGDFRFREFKGSIYFEALGGFYKITDNEVVMISKDEYKEQAKFKRLIINDIGNVRYVSTYVSSIMIDEVLMAKHNITISTKVENSNVVPIISNKFPTVVKRRIDDISRRIISALPYVDRNNVKREVKKILSSMFEDGSEYFSEMINMIYENDKNRFDRLASDIKYQIEKRNQSKNQKTQYTNGFVSDKDSSFEPEGETIERKTK